MPTTPLPIKLIKLFSYQSSVNSNGSANNDPLSPSLYTTLTLDDCDDYSNQNTQPFKQNFTDLNENDSTVHLPVYNESPSREFVYNDFINKRLAKYGLTETCKIILKMIEITPIQRTRQLLQLNSKNEFYAHHWMPLHETVKEYIKKYDWANIETSIDYEYDQTLQLPSFRPVYLFLLNSILDLMSTCMQMYIDIDKRIKEEHNFNFSILSTEQLTNECRECIQYAIIARQYYHYLVYSVLTKQELEANLIENILSEKYDVNLNKLIQIYLEHVISWVHYCNDNTKNNTKALCILENEWNFCKNYLNLCFLSDEYYAKRFCSIISGTYTI